MDLLDQINLDVKQKSLTFALIVVGAVLWVFGAVSTYNLAAALFTNAAFWYSFFLIFGVDVASALFGGLKRFHAQNTDQIKFANVGFSYTFAVNVAMLITYFAVFANNNLQPTQLALTVISVAIGLHVGAVIWLFWQYTNSSSDIQIRIAKNAMIGKVATAELKAQTKMLEGDLAMIAETRATGNHGTLKTQLLRGYKPVAQAPHSDPDTSTINGYKLSDVLDDQERHTEKLDKLLSLVSAQQTQIEQLQKQRPHWLDSVDPDGAYTNGRSDGYVMKGVQPDPNA